MEWQFFANFEDYEEITRCVLNLRPYWTNVAYQDLQHQEDPGSPYQQREYSLKLCDEGTNEGTGLDGKGVCFRAAVESHVFNSVHLIL